MHRVKRASGRGAWTGAGLMSGRLPALLVLIATSLAPCVARSADERSPESTAGKDLQLGLIASLSVPLADSLYGRCIPAFSAAQQGVDLSSPLDAYYTGLLLLRRGEFADAAADLRRASGRGAPGKEIPARIRARAALLAGACDTWSRGEPPAARPDPEEAAIVEAWNAVLLDRWPDPSRLADAKDGSALRKLVIALASRNAEAVRAAVADKALFAADYPETRSEGSREFIDPLPVLLAAKGYFLLAEVGYLRAVDEGKANALEAAAFAALLAGDMQGLEKIIGRSDAPALACYRSALPGPNAGDKTALLTSNNDAKVKQAQARVLGFALKDTRASVERYDQLLASTKETARTIPLRREGAVACVLAANYEPAFRYADGLWQRDHADPFGLLARSCADMGREGFRNFGAAALLQENLTIPGGLCDQFGFLNALKTATWLYVKLYSPIDRQGAGVK